MATLLEDALSLVARVNERLRPNPQAPRPIIVPKSRLGGERLVLDNRRCLVLAGLIDADLY
jgi:hypothetical protein